MEDDKLWGPGQVRIAAWLFHAGGTSGMEHKAHLPGLRPIFKMQGGYGCKSAGKADRIPTIGGAVETLAAGIVQSCDGVACAVHENNLLPLHIPGADAGYLCRSASLRGCAVTAGPFGERQDHAAVGIVACHDPCT